MHYLCSRYLLSSDTERTEKIRKWQSRAHFAFVTHETRSAGVLSALNEMFARLDSSTTGSKSHGLCMIPIFILHFVHHMWKNVWDAFKMHRTLTSVDCAVRAISCTLFAFIIFLPCASPPLVRTAMALPAPLIRSFSKSTCMMEDRRYKPFNGGKHARFQQTDSRESFLHSPHAAHEFVSAARARTRVWLRLLFVLRVPASIFCLFLNKTSHKTSNYLSRRLHMIDLNWEITRYNEEFQWIP